MPIERTIQINMKDGTLEDVCYIVDHRRFCFSAGDDDWRSCQKGEYIEEALVREWTNVCKENWPNSPEHWPMTDEDGDIYWCISPSNETNAYKPDLEPLRPLRPWRGKLRLEKRGGSMMYNIHRFSKETGKIDTDSNATSFFVDTNGFWRIESDANKAYVNALTQYIAHKEEELLELKEELSLC